MFLPTRRGIAAAVTVITMLVAAPPVLADTVDDTPDAPTTTTAAFGDESTVAAPAAVDTGGDPSGTTTNGATVDAPPVDGSPSIAAATDAAAAPSDDPSSPDPDAATDAAVPALEPEVDDLVAEETGTQTAEVLGTGIAVAITGHNQVTGSSVGSPTGAPGGAGTVEIASGDADAVGSSDESSVVQQATATVSDDATADISQLVIIFNVGGAASNSGANGASSGGSNGVTSDRIATGDALAIGNDSETYLTQAAAVDAPNGAIDSSVQDATSVRIAISYADSGSNTITATLSLVPVGASIATGGADATGNLATTVVSQDALAAGSGTAHLSIEQQAIVLNLGLALANSGANHIGSLLEPLLTVRDQLLTQQLLAVLLPAILESSEEVIATAGDISTGHALAIGNMSHTEIEQSALALATGDGRASVSQTATVVNAGVGIANTGSNGATSGHHTAGSDAVGLTEVDAADPLDAALAGIIAELAAQIDAMLRQIDEWFAGDDDALSPSSLSLPYGDALLGLEQAFDGVRIESTSGGVRISQLTAFLNLGIAWSNTGANIATSSSDGGSTVGTRAPGHLVITGNASAANIALVVICQLDDRPTHQCLAPPEPPPPPPPPPPPLAPPEVVVPEPPAPPVIEPPVDPDVVRPIQRPTPEPPPAVRPSAPSVGLLPATGTDVHQTLSIAIGLVIVGTVLSAAAVKRPRRT